MSKATHEDFRKKGAHSSVFQDFLIDLCHLFVHHDYLAFGRDERVRSIGKGA